MDWLRGLLERLLSVFPRIYILTPFEAGLKFNLGKHVKKVGAGWYLIWPWFQKFIYMDVNTQIVDLRTQSIRTIDGVDIVVSGAVQYNINDVEKALINTRDVDKSIETLSLAIILDYVHKKTLDECQDIDSLKNEIKKGLKKVARHWGVEIEMIHITDIGRTRNIRLLTNSNVPLESEVI